MLRKLLAGAALLISLVAQAQSLPPFRPVGATTNLAVTASAQSLTLPTDLSGSVSVQYVLTNVGTQTVFCRFDGVTATVGNAFSFLANSQILITLADSIKTMSCIAASTGSTMYASVGLGS